MAARALTIGNFDGVHAGHKRVISRLCELSDKPTVFTFSNHPSEVLQASPKKMLSHPDHKLALLEKMAVEVIIEPFTPELSKLSPEEFLKRFEIDHLILGHDAAFGFNRTGQAAELERLSRKMGFNLEYMEPLHYKNRPISSSYIREVIEKGDFITALPLLGRPYSIQGKVKRGAGRHLGYPTANLDVSGLCLPPFGVYHVRVGEYEGVANLGTAPTFDGKKEQLEVHLLNFSGDLYDQVIDVIFLKFLRPEKRFESKEALIKQIQADINYCQLG